MKLLIEIDIPNGKTEDAVHALIYVANEIVRDGLPTRPQYNSVEDGYMVRWKPEGWA